MLTDIVVPVASAIGAAVAAGASAYRAGQAAHRALGESTLYVRLSAEDSDRVAKIDALLERLIALEEQTQTAITRLAEEVGSARLEQARREGFFEGRLDLLGERK